jgi:N12 class adenine-specific DNA methylase/antirestriction protein ArdC/phage/plasmid primase-like uncharacterized protein
MKNNPFQRNLFEEFFIDESSETTDPVITIPEGNIHATSSVLNTLSGRDTETAQINDPVGNRDSESLGDGMAGSGDGVDRLGGILGSIGESGATGEGNIVTAGQQSSGETRDIAGVRAESSATSSENFVVDADEIGKGGLAQKYKDNVAAIRIVKTMEEEGRAATFEERKLIAKYVGWGGIKGVFDPENKQWAKQHLELKELLTDEEFRAARRSTLDAHYTPPVAVGAMYDALERLGFTDGRMLESSIGIGTFFGMMPRSMRDASQLHGVELDSLTSRLVSALYPKAKIAQATGFEDYQVPAEYFDVTIGNPPFGSQPLVDAERSAYSGFNIHNYFLAKSIDKLRPGGIMEVVVSHNFLDGNDGRARKWIGDRASLIGAVRLPNTAFKENAGTEVVSDILIFQKHDNNGLPRDSGQWRDVVDQVNVNPKTGDSVTHKVNQFFVDNPQFVLGTPSAGGFMYTANEYTVEESGDLKEQLAGWVNTLPEQIFVNIDRRADSAVVDLDIPDNVKVGSFFVDDSGTVMQRSHDVMGNKTANEWNPPNEKAVARMKGMVALRDLLREQMRLERSTSSSELHIEANRAKMNTAYDTFLKQHGHLNSQTNRRIFLDDTEASLLQALEFDYDKGISKAVAEKEGIDQRAPSAVKADIFNRRVAFPPQDYMTVSTAKDALLASLNYRGKVDGDYMAEVYGKPFDDIMEELGDVVYNDPNDGVVTADEYLSGDVKTKLAQAITASQSDERFNRNVEALEKVIPKDKKPSEISVSLGAAFIPGEIYQQFVEHISGGSATAGYIKSTGQWILAFSGQGDPALNRGKFGTSDLSAQELMQLTMLGRGAVVRQTIRHADGSTSTLVLEKETEAAREKQNAIKDEWKRWLWSDPERADKLAALYNDKMNRIVNRKFDGSHLTFPGMNPAISLLEHQKNGVWRGLQSYQVLYDHVVGAGKTFEMATLAMEMRRLGIARKPLFVVPNHLTLQWRSEFTRLYPGSNVLAATPEDFSKDNRERLFSKIVTGDWDAVVIGHSSLKKIGLPIETEKAVLQEQVEEIGDAIEELKRDRGDRNIIRDMEGIRTRLEARMKDKLAAVGKRSEVVTFDELGVDALFVDEMHEFKNLNYHTTMDRNPGMGNPNGSAKAFDMFVKTRWLFDTFGEKTPFITATGTPVSNSLVEMYNMQRYMQYPTLKEEGLHVFDAWAKQYGNVENVYEVAPSGSGYRQSTRFAKFTNLPSLMSLYNSFADTITLDDLKAQEEAQGKRFPVPKLVGGKPVLVVAQRSPQVAALMGVPRAEVDEAGSIKFLADLSKDITIEKSKDSDKFLLKVGDRAYAADTEQDARLKLVELAVSPDVKVQPDSILGRFERLRELTRSSKGKVNALSLTGEANKAGLDYRLIDPTAPDYPGSKINLAVENMMKVYHQWDADKGTQLVFCDMSVPLSARNNYSSKDRRLYIRDDAGAIDMKRGTMHTLDGHEDLPYFIVQRGDKDNKRFDVFDAASGVLIAKDSRTKQDARDAANSMLMDDDKRQSWINMREAAGEIEQGQIDEFNNEHDVETEGFEFFTREDIAGMSGSAKFSVYDDIKAKLIAKGVPEREIAFIHDYSTPAAKDKLFKAVNSGKIRFTLGSTPKMGAGTNVQRLLVGLHHIDAPWRPSDLEQREGRIIRRGNFLYNRDPDNFEVFIGRYATEQTYDTRRWQILEHKARGIEQLRNYDGSINEIDDIEGEAANAADMKAAASGDPLILEETKLRNNVRRLEQLQAGHADEVLSMTRRARDAQEYVDVYGPRYLSKLSDYVETINSHPLDKKGFSPVTVGGQTYIERDKAQDAITDAIEKLRAEESGSESTIVFRGMAYTFKRGLSTIAVESLSGERNMWADNDPFSASGFIQRMTNDIGRLPGAIDQTRARMEKSAKDAVAMLEQAKQPFLQADELEATRIAYKKTQRALLVKGPSVPDDQKADLAKGIAAQKQRLDALGFGDALKEFFSGNSEHLNIGVGEEAISQSHEVKDDHGYVPAPAEMPLMDSPQGFTGAVHQMTKEEFAEIASAIPLVNHGRKWEVKVGELSYGFSDLETAPEAVADIHKAIVNNALYSRSTNNSNGVLLIQSMPSERVMKDYPDLQEEYADVLKVEPGEAVSQAAEFDGVKVENKAHDDLANKFIDFNKQETKRMSSGNKKPFHEVVAEKLIDQLQAGTAPWQRKWQAGEPSAFVPINPTTGKRYRGINAIQLMSQGYTDQRWMTYNQAAAVGAQVLKGEKSTPIQYWKFTEQQDKLDEQGKPVLGEDGKPIKIEVRLERPRVFFASVFNAEQIEGLPPLQRKEQGWDGIERAEHVLQASGANIRHGEQNRAFYRPSTDSIHLPDKSQFETADNYYSTALHELGHWTGHESRLNRDIKHPFGSEWYAREELRAEIFSMIIGDELGVGHDPGQHAAYVGSWVKALQEDPMEIFRASADAEKILDYVFSLEQKQVHELAKDQGPDQVDNQEQIITELKALHASANPGYSPLESWENLNATAEANGLQAVLARGGNGEYDPPFAITYRQDGLLTNISTELHLDGKAVSCVAGERIAGTGLTSDLEWQSTALNNAVTLFRSQSSNQGAGMELPANAPVSQEITWLNVPFKEKDSAKSIGAKWDRKESSWYVPAGVDPTPFSKWAKPAVPSEAVAPNVAAPSESEGLTPKVSVQEKQYLAVPYDDRLAAKEVGARWDKVAKSWYVGENANMEKLSRWLPENVATQQGPAMQPREEFEDALLELGFVLTGDHPIMDGKKHRCLVKGDHPKQSEKTGAGFYVAHLDGKPNGYAKNNRTGSELKWVSKGYSLDPAEKAQIAAQAAARLKEREADILRLQERSSKAVVELLAVAPMAPPTHKYLTDKQALAGDLRVVPANTDALPKDTIIKIGADWKESKQLREDHPDSLVFTAGDLLLSGQDVSGKVWTVQTIQENGSKCFVKDSKKEGCFHVVGGLDALAKAPAIVIGEGYATVDSMAGALGFATVSAFDSGNLPHVAKLLHEKFPDKPVVIGGDDDLHQLMTNGKNPGKIKAEEAAAAVDGRVLFPIFAPGEQDSNPRGFSDFNDLATKSVLGKEGVKRQVGSIVNDVIQKHQVQREQKRVQEQAPVKRQAAKI